MILLQSIIYKDPPAFISIGKKKPKKYYTSYNSIYSSPHHTVRTTIVDLMKLYLLTKITAIKPITGKVYIEYIHSRKRKGFDISNKGAIWCKVFCDMLVQKGKIPDDNVEYVKKVSYDYEYCGEEQLTINIYQA